MFPSILRLAVLAFALLAAGCSEDTAAERDEPSVGSVTQDSPVGSDDSADSSGSVQSTLTPTTEPKPTPSIAWDELPPIDVPADLVPEDYDGRFVSYNTVLDLGEGPIMCTPVIAATSPPYCEGVPIEGFSWDDVDHDEQAGSRWGQYALLGRWDDRTFTLTEPAFPIDWSQVRTPEPEPVNVPCPEPEGGWWSDLTDAERVSSGHYNDAISVVNTRAELLSIDIVEPDEPRPDAVRVDVIDEGWIPGLVVIRLSELRDGDEEAIRAYWGGPLCLAVVDGLSNTALFEIERQIISDIENDISPMSPISDIIGVGVNDGEVQVGMWVATVEAQTRLDQQFGPGAVRLMGLLWAID